MPVFVLNFQEFEDKCFCVCEPISLRFDGPLEAHLFNGAEMLRNNNGSPSRLRNRAGLSCARYDRYEASQVVSFSTQVDESFFYSIVVDEEVIDRVHVYERSSSSGSLEMNIVVNYLDVDKLYEKGARLEDEEYILDPPDHTGSTFRYESTSYSRIPYLDDAGQPRSYDGNISIVTREWEVQEDKRILQTTITESTISRIEISRVTGEPEIVTRPKIVNTRQAILNIPLSLDRDTFLSGDLSGFNLGLKAEEESSLTINAIEGSHSSLKNLDVSNSEVVDTRFGKPVTPHTLTRHSRYNSVFNSKVERLTPPLFQIRAQVENKFTFKYFPHDENPVDFDPITNDPIPLEPNRRYDGIPITFDYVASGIETVGWVFNEDSDSRPSDKVQREDSHRFYYSPINNRTETANDTCLIATNAETNYMPRHLNNVFHYPGGGRDPRFAG